MAQRAQEKTKRAPARQKHATPGAAGRDLDERYKALERERDDLKASLEAARGRIAALEDSRNQIANRIDWVIESLQGLVENGD
jgi:DNA repair exonuclease SbcCD ATPase subunit